MYQTQKNLVWERTGLLQFSTSEQVLTLTQVPISGHASGGCWVVAATVQEHWDGRYPPENCTRPPRPAHSYLVPEILQLKVHSLTKIEYFQIFIS